MLCSEVRLARVEEKTEYALKLDEYFKQKSATNTIQPTTRHTYPPRPNQHHQSPQLSRTLRTLLTLWLCVYCRVYVVVLCQGYGEEAIAGGRVTWCGGEEESKAGNSTTIVGTSGGMLGESWLMCEWVGIFIEGS